MVSAVTMTMTRLPLKRNFVVEGVGGLGPFAATLVGTVGDQLCCFLGFDAPTANLKKRPLLHAELGFHLARLQLDDRHGGWSRIPHKLDLCSQVADADAAARCARG